MCPVSGRQLQSIFMIVRLSEPITCGRERLQARTAEYSRQSRHFRTPVSSSEQRPSMAAVTAGICSWSPSTHSTTAPAIVALMMIWSRLMGPIRCSASRACFGASGVSFTSGGTSCKRRLASSALLCKALEQSSAACQEPTAPHNPPSGHLLS